MTRPALGHTPSTSGVSVSQKNALYTAVIALGVVVLVNKYGHMAGGASARRGS